jgi:hypothetical protein
MKSRALPGFFIFACHGALIELQPDDLGDSFFKELVTL